jgi:transposase
MIDVQTVDAASAITLLEAIEALYPLMMLIHVFVDNARYHHAKLVQEWLARPGCRIKLHFIPSYCPHLNPRLWGLKRYAQQMLRNLCAIRRRDVQFPTRTSSSQLGALLRLGHRQRHLAEEFSGPPPPRLVMSTWQPKNLPRARSKVCNSHVLSPFALASCLAPETLAVPIDFSRLLSQWSGASTTAHP